MPCWLAFPSVHCYTLHYSAWQRPANARPVCKQRAVVHAYHAVDYFALRTGWMKPDLAIATQLKFMGLMVPFVRFFNVVTAVECSIMANFIMGGHAAAVARRVDGLLS
ncbi:hypothetical protein JDV02_002424 [Purpureocillium takamizusanense]|uniref:Uncharacterized protein n=1 Tax=Purpureocillium takamizusanense TaxID=2060973 RepID=A0A9Q8QA99_9HYPO|nr:uncharacterized protein JDV02_002424 [Purpureocillium takamizusanense]UNI15940.1 hypothetical protein JDV02_002424 [Purpureocillium takamizusanense]